MHEPRLIARGGCIPRIPRSLISTRIFINATFLSDSLECKPQAFGDSRGVRRSEGAERLGLLGYRGLTRPISAGAVLHSFALYGCPWTSAPLKEGVRLAKRTCGLGGRRDGAGGKIGGKYKWGA